MLQNIFVSYIYIFTFLDSLLEGLQGFPTLKQIVSLNIGLKRIICDYNQGHIIRELRTRDPPPLNCHTHMRMSACIHHDIFITSTKFVLKSCTRHSFWQMAICKHPTICGGICIYIYNSPIYTKYDI